MKRRGVILILIAMVVLSVLGVVTFTAREPEYEGRKLSTWLFLSTRYGEDEPQWQAASNAVHQMGPQVIPWLLKWGSAEHSHFKAAVIHWANSHPALHIHPQSEFIQMNLAFWGFGLLKGDARAASPTLVQWAADKSPVRRERALMCLNLTEADKATRLPVLRRLLNDPDLQRRAASSIQQYYPEEAEAAGVYKLFPDLKALPPSESGTNAAELSK